MAIGRNPRVCFHRFSKNGQFCTAPGCGFPRAYVEAQPPQQSEQDDKSYPEVPSPTEGFDF